MRKYKFRGKRVDNGEWVYGDLLYIAGGCVIYFGSPTDTVEPDIEKSNPVAVELFNDECAVVVPDTIGQFTGLPDKNGKEIYVGDIVKNKKGTIDVITYDSLAFALCVAYATSPNGVCATFFGNNNPLKDLEVIGNIHDNPELLKGASNE